MFQINFINTNEAINTWHRSSCWGCSARQFYNIKTQNLTQIGICKKVFETAWKSKLTYLCNLPGHNIGFRSIHYSDRMYNSLMYNYLSSQYILHLIHIYKYFHDKYPMRSSNRHWFGTLKAIYTVLKSMISTWID